MTDLEPMGAFFDARLALYDAHQLDCIQGARTFYPFTASLLPPQAGCRVLDLGCGTGLELEAYFARNPAARVTGIDLAPGMLQTLREKFPAHPLELVQASYFDVDFGVGIYDAAVSVESLHHFPQGQKTALYHKLCRAIKPGGYFILTDYFAPDDHAERTNFQELSRMRSSQGLPDNELYHYDTPLTLAHEREALLDGGFRAVEVLGQWANTVTLKALRRS